MPALVFKVPKVPINPLGQRKLPTVGARSTKLLTAGAAIIISISMVSFLIFAVISNNKHFRETHNIAGPGGTATPPENTSDKSALALPGGGTAVGTGGTTGTNSPVVTLTATPASVIRGGTSKLAWSTTNSPTNCTASDDWSGSKSPSGSESTASLSVVQTYIFTLTCKNATGTGFATVSIGAVDQGGSGGASRPVVSLAANPSQVFAGQSSTLNWDVSNSPSSCTASGDWGGVQTTPGTYNTGTLTTTKSYSYTLTCTNSAGSGYATATVAVADPPPDRPLITMYYTPVGSVTQGTGATITWSTTNNPTSCTASGDWSGSKAASGSFQTGNLNTIKNYAYTLSCKNVSGSSTAAASIDVVPPVPNVSLTVAPSSATVGSAVTISWSVTNSPTSCTPSNDLSGVTISPLSGGSRSYTPAAARTYLFTLKCSNAGGDATTNAQLVATNPSPPVASISVSPISVTTGGSATVSWSATNSPTSCTASGNGQNWSGAKAVNGPQSTGTLNTVGTFTYSISCSNAGGTGPTASTSVSVTSGTVTSVPVVTITATPNSIGTGASSTIAWSATNSPTSCTASGNGPGGWSGAKSGSGTMSSGAVNTAGTYTYTLSCSNTAGASSPASATLTVLAVPSVTGFTINPTVLTAGASATAAISWGSTNGATSCTAGGSWTGSKGATGTNTTVGPITTAGSYTYTLACTNGAGTGPTASVSLTATAPTTSYCVVGGVAKTPCYGPNDLAGHTSQTSCWAYNLNRVVNVTSLNNGYHSQSPGNLLPSGYTSICGNIDLGPFLRGSSSIPGLGTHNHSGSKTNTGIITSYLQGYYDAAKP